MSQMYSKLRLTFYHHLPPTILNESILLLGKYSRRMSFCLEIAHSTIAYI